MPWAKEETGSKLKACELDIWKWSFNQMKTSLRGLGEARRKNDVEN
jgi:hypothetical protein